MAKSYKHLTYTQRCQIDILKGREISAAEIAREIGVHRSTIIRELKRNGLGRKYHCKDADDKAQERRKHPKNKKLLDEMIIFIEKKLREKWSPEQISGFLKRQNTHISYETIYKHVRKDKSQGGSLYQHLRHRGKKYNRRHYKTHGRSCIPNRLDIKDRPPIVEEKTRLGDWEIDTIIGANHNGAIVSIVDRTAKYTKLMKVSCKKAKEVEEAIIKALDPIQQFVHTLTADNGIEFANHQTIGIQLKAHVYFATPYHSWERGLNEHTNGLVRQYFPKGLRFDEITHEDVKAVENALNNRPRKSLCFETPSEVFKRLSINS